MPITYPINTPNNNIASMTMSMSYANAGDESPFTFQQQIVGFQGERWSINFSTPPMVRNDAEDWIAFSLSLMGRRGTFLASPPDALVPRGVASGTPLVKGAGQSGHTLLIDGVPATVTNWLRKGDYFQIGTGSTARLHKLILDASSNGAGEVTLDFMPALRYQPADNAPIVVTGAKGLFRMVSDEVPWTVNSEKFYSFSFAAVEVIG